MTKSRKNILIPRPVLIILIIIGIFAWTAMMLKITWNNNGKICTNYQGFAVDENQNLYLGKKGYIQVFDASGNPQHTINAHTTRGYSFTIINNELYLHTGDLFYIMDLNGNTTEHGELSDEMRVFISDHTKRNKFTASDGTEYVLNNPLNRPTIYRMDNEQKTMIYQMPGLDYTIDSLSSISYVLLIIPALIILFRSKNSNKTH